MARGAAVAADSRQRRQVRRTAIVLALVALAFYATFILYAVRHGHA